MKTLIFWRDRYDRSERLVYKGKVGGALWDQFIVNARNGHGYCVLIDAKDVKDAQSRLHLRESTSIPFVQVHGEGAIKALRSQGGKTLTEMANATPTV
jgi:hypothetical protein